MASEAKTTTTTTATATARMRVASMPRPIITAPLSRVKRQSSSIGRWYIILLSAILAVGVVAPMTVMLMLDLATLPSSNGVLNRGGSEHNGIQSSLRHQSTAEVVTPSDDAVASARGLSIHTPLGDIRIHFTPELSGPSSIQYIVDVVRQAQLMAIEESMKDQRRRMLREVGYKCTKCNFYRAETNLLLQGTIDDAYFPTNVELGPCPDKDHVSKLRCPEHDPNCGCHGPIMTRGMVGWAGGHVRLVDMLV